MRLSIINRVSEILSEKRLNVQTPKKIESVKVDKVEISSAGNEIKQIADRIAAAEDVGRVQKLQDLKKAIQLGEYRLNDAVVNSIAENIAKTLL
jgi:anti-sigma28 factor (negative regulator of flagellin synthesis)